MRLILCLQLSFCFFRTAPCLWSQRYCKLGLQGWTDDLLQWTCWTSTDLVTSWFTASLCSENFNFLFKMKDMWAALGSSQYWIITLKLSQGNLERAMIEAIPREPKIQLPDEALLAKMSMRVDAPVCQHCTRNFLAEWGLSSVSSCQEQFLLCDLISFSTHILCYLITPDKKDWSVLLALASFWCTQGVP